MKNKSLRYASLAVVLVLAAVGSAVQASAQQVRLAARATKTINGIDAQLRGDYRANGAPQRLNAQLENINLPVGTPVAFCILQNGVNTLLGRGKVTVVGGVNVAFVELNVNDGDIVPTVSAGERLQARQRTTAPFRTNPGCGAEVLVFANFK